jgi:hypothetical protein
MAELEQQLRSLAAEIDWPSTPELRLPALPDRRRRPLRRPLLVAVAVLLIAAVVASLVPGARSAILHWFRIGGARVERVQTLPPAARQSLTAALGRPVARAEAERALGGGASLPTGQLYLRDGVVSALIVTDAGPVLFGALRSRDAPFVMKKLASGSTNVEFVDVVRNGMGIWVAGAPHVVIFPVAPPRLAGNVLLWTVGGLTYRLEGARLERQDALDLARR